MPSALHYLPADDVRPDDVGDDPRAGEQVIHAPTPCASVDELVERFAPFASVEVSRYVNMPITIKVAGYAAWSQRIYLRDVETKLDVQLVHE